MIEAECGRVLIARAGSQFAALPLAHISEVMRPLPLQTLSNLPPAVLGLTTVRGNPLPVLDLTQLLTGTPAHSHSRCVAIKAPHERAFVLAVESLHGIIDLDSALTSLPPLLGAGHAETIRAVSALDSRLLLLLQTARLLNEESWARITSARTVSAREVLA